MNSSSWEKQRFIEAPEAEAVLRAFKDKSSGLQLKADIRLEAAVEALREGFSLTEIVQHTVCQLEIYIITHILKSTNGNKAETARLLKVDYKTLYRKMCKYFGTFLDEVPDASSDEQIAATNGDGSRKSVNLS